MKIINPYTEILTPLDGRAILQHIELCGRVCYKSEDKITDTSAAKFVAGIIKRGHEAVLEHFDITVKFVCDRGVSHEIVRHRMASYCQESTRYCNYSKDAFGSEITVIRPSFLTEGTPGWQYWKVTCRMAEKSYFELLDWGCTPQEARAVLPTCLKTEVVMTANLREWRHFFKLRTAPAAHPQMREVAIPLLHQMRSQVPVIFDDIEEAAQLNALRFWRPPAAVSAVSVSRTMARRRITLKPSACSGVSTSERRTRSLPRSWLSMASPPRMLAPCWPCSRWPASPPAPAPTALLIWQAMRPAPVKS